MDDNITIAEADAASPEAKQMIDALWSHIQTCYGFTAPNPIDITSYTAAKAGFWLARNGEGPVGSIALVPLSDKETELDIMYVIPSYRGKGVAHSLMQMAEQFARENGFSIIKLRAGAPQPDALRFYGKEGFKQVPVFGRWVFDETAICLAKEI